ncbi:MAG TPA: hypothetical protein VK589_14255 [Chryseolinea sp.]|nr:hypothetical protein [Chryseolinea sp.]
MTLDENDYLTYQLYTASKTPRIRKARIRSWILTTVAFLCLTYLFFENSNDLLGYYFLVASVLSLTLNPIYSRWRYKRHYLKYIQDTFKKKFGEETTLEITEDYIATRDKTGEAKINTTQIEAINEIKDFYFVQMRTGESLIISKVKTDDPDSLKREITSLIEKKVIKHNVELDWRWK